MAYMHWIFLSLISLGLLIAAIISLNISDLPRWSLYADWATAIVGGAGVIVAGLAAYYLRRTLTETQEGTRLMREQLWSNRAYLACTSIKAEFKGTYSGEEYASAVIRIKSEWRNFGTSPALEAIVRVKEGRLKAVEWPDAGSESVCESELDKSVTSIIGQGERGITEQQIEVPLYRTGLDPEHPGYAPIQVTLFAEYKDVHNRQFLVENVHSIVFQVSLYEGQIQGLAMDPTTPTNTESMI